jgi:hypothetical protein
MTILIEYLINRSGLPAKVKITNMPDVKFLSSKIMFVKKHYNDCYICFKSESEFNKEIASKLIKFARIEIGYKKSTTSIDIYNSLHNLYDKLTTNEFPLKDK